MRVAKSRQPDEVVQLMLLHLFLVPPLPHLGGKRAAESSDLLLLLS